MKKVFLLVIFSIVVFAQNFEVKLFSELFTTLFNKKPVYIYTENKKYKTLHSLNLFVTNNCKKADIVLGVSEKCKDKPHFLLDYYNYKNDKNAIGALYWRKGRPQLRLREDNIKKYNLIIAPSFSEYLE